MVYKPPPKKRRTTPDKESEDNNGLRNTTIIHPITTYIMVENVWNLPIKNSFRIIPVKAMIHTNENRVHPIQPCNVIRAKGVYVPAVSIYIQA